MRANLCGPFYSIFDFSIERQGSLNREKMAVEAKHIAKKTVYSHRLGSVAIGRQSSNAAILCA